MDRKIILYIAMSLDGFIADVNGNVNWLHGHNPNYSGIDTYSPFIKDIDTVIMGNKTYQQIIHELSIDIWPYQDMTSYVLTHQKQNSKNDIHFTDQSIDQLIKEIKTKDGVNIWICGGAQIINQMLKLKLIDRYHITIVPTILGQGTRLFGHDNPTQKLRLLESQNYNGMIDCIYEIEY